MPRIVRARHVAYGPPPYGKPFLRELPDASCFDSLPEFLASRHIGYAPDGSPLEAFASNCCDAFCDEGETGTGTGHCYQRSDLWPLGPGPGITRRVRAYLADTHSCFSAEGKYADLYYSSADGKWHGSTSLIGGTITLTFQVNAGGTGDPGKFSLTYSCNGDSGTVTAGANCFTPLVVGFPMVSLPNCCSCPSSSSPATTDEGAEVTVYVVANCLPVRFGRHVAYLPDGTPLVAKARNCTWDAIERGCGIMTCPLNLAVTNVLDCECFAGNYTANRLSGAWEALSFGGCAPGTANISCEDFGRDATGKKLVKLTIVITCGVDHTGTGSVVLRADDMETLDETVFVDISGPAPTCTGNCTYVWNEMAMVWQLTGDTCSVACDDCPNSPTSPPSSPVDGQVYNEACSGGIVAECCEGTIAVRITRA